MKTPALTASAAGRKAARLPVATLLLLFCGQALEVAGAPVAATRSAATASATASSAQASATPPSIPQAKAAAKPPAPRKADRSGKSRKGKASFYGHQFAGKKMADGTPMNPQADVAASKTLPLGTVAQVTNLENGKSAVVEIRDRGPYKEDRIVDLSPKTAEKIAITEQGVAPVEVKPLTLPPPDSADSKPAPADNPKTPPDNQKTPPGARKADSGR